MIDFKNYYGYIYRITNLVNGKTYIGSRKLSYDNGDFERYYGSGTCIRSSIKKYGKINHKKEIICFVEKEEDIYDVETNHILKEKSIGKAEYNIATHRLVPNSYKRKATQKEVNKKISLGVRKNLIERGKQIKKDPIVNGKRIYLLKCICICVQCKTLFLSNRKRMYCCSRCRYAHNKLSKNIFVDKKYTDNMIIRDYIYGYSLSQISKKSGLSRPAIFYILRRNNIERRDSKSTNRIIE